MTREERWRAAISPPVEVSKADTGLRFTDILFGFVIKELFVRLQNWGHLAGVVRWQLVTGTALVLGSWIGFRRSLNRTAYEVKFFNLPFWRFLLDQVMVILYFYIAVLTSADPKATVSSASLLHATVVVLLVIFVLYLVWDFGGLIMAWAKDDDGYKYREIDEKERKPTAKPSPHDWPAFWITFAFLAAFVILYAVIDHVRLGGRGTQIAFVIATALLVLYRFAKEVKTSWRTLSKDAASTTPRPPEGVCKPGASAASS